MDRVELEDAVFKRLHLDRPIDRSTMRDAIKLKPTKDLENILSKMIKEGRTDMEEQTAALALPSETQFRQDIAAINKFQQVVHACMIKDQDYGVIPGTTKPTLLKPGAEKIVKLLGLADTYEILDSKEDWQLPFFRYLIKARLVHIATGVVISEGMGECNSYESKYRYRWVGDRDVPAGINKFSLVSQERKSFKTGGHWTVYRLDNDDIFSQVNTILKMAKKRALVDAALSAGRLSDVFTQDIEDIPSMTQRDFTAEKPAERARTEPKPPKSQMVEEVEPTESQSEGVKQETGSKAPREPSSIKDFGSLYTACKEDWPQEFKTRQAVWKELGVTSQEELAETPAELYQRIVAARS